MELTALEVTINAETFGQDVIEVQSLSNPKVWYRVDILNGRCSCPAWKFQRGGSRKPCKHLKALGFTEVLASTKGLDVKELEVL